MIVRNGVDVTQEVFAEVEAHRRASPLDADEAISNLLAARSALDNQPRPWLFDCIYDSIQKIDAIIEELRDPK